MRSLVLSLVLLAGLSAGALAPTPAVAQSKEIYVYGEGTRTCRDYLRQRAKESPNQNYFYVTWLRGFLAGYNVATSFAPTTSDLPAAYDLLVRLDKYCMDNPRKRIVDGAIALASELGGVHRR